MMGVLATLLSNRGYIPVNRCAAKAYGLDEAVLLGELAEECEYWETRGELKDGFFYSTLENVEENTTLARRKQDKAIKTLKSAGAISVKLSGTPPKRYFKIHEDVIAANLYKTYKLNCTECTNQNVQNVQNDLYKAYKLNCTECTTNNNKKNNKNNNKESKGDPQNPRGGKRPTVQEVADYISEKGYGIDPQEFCDFYASKGWKVGSQPMVDWKAAVRTWVRRDKKRNTNANYAQHTDSGFSIDDIALNLDGEDG